MDTKKLNRITWKRARPIILSLGILLILIGIFTGFNSTNNWHKDQNFIHSQEARNDYKSYVKDQLRIEEGINKKYEKTNDYQNALDFGYNNGTQSIMFNPKTGEFSINYATFESYFGYIHKKLFYHHKLTDLIYSNYMSVSTNIYIGLSLLSFIFLITGFSISFLDYKTNFILLLFSSGYNRKEILKSNIRTSLIPLTFIAITAFIVNMVIIYSRIPHQYVNYPLDKIIFYQFCLLLIAICYFFLGLFSGIILGQGITGVLSLIGFVFGVELTKQNILDLFNNILPNKNDGSYYQSFFVRFDTYSNWLILDGFVIFIVFLLYFSSLYFYKRLSLEERGNYLLFPKFRLSISLVAGLFTAYSICGNIGLSSNSDNLLIRYNILPGILVFMITFCLFMVLNNYKNMYEKFGVIILKNNN